MSSGLVRALPFQPGKEGYNKGKKFTEEHKRNLAKAFKETYENGRVQWNKNKTLSQEHIETI
ncbi:MAG: hypothetical protein ACRD8W_30150 [Nitrososphaeraceae archaeon]